MPQTAAQSRTTPPAARQGLGFIPTRTKAGSGLTQTGPAGDLVLSADVQAILDGLGTMQGDIIYRGATDWTVLAPGTAGFILTTGGPTADPSWTAAATGDITAVIAGTGLSGGGISGSVTLNLADTAVKTGSYTYTALTVDAQGRLTAASSGAAPVAAITQLTGDVTAGPGSGSVAATLTAKQTGVHEWTAAQTFDVGLVTAPHTVATLPATPTDGQRDFVTDALAPTVLVGVTGGGAVHVPVYYDGGAAAWKVG